MTAKKKTPAAKAPAPEQKETTAPEATKEASIPAPADPVAATEVPKVEEPTPEVTEKEEPAIYQSPVDEKLSSVAKVALGGLNRFVEITDPKTMRIDREFSAAQLQLNDAFNAMLALDGVELSAVYKEFVKNIRENREGAFSERYVFRGFQDLKLSASRRRAFEYTITMFLTIADTKDAKDFAKIFNIELAMTAIADEEKVQKLQNLFGA